MDAYRVIRHPGDEDEGARWACGARRRVPVEIASGPAPVVLCLGANLAVRVVRGRNPFIPPLVGAASRFCLTDLWPRMGVPGERMTEESYVT